MPDGSGNEKRHLVEPPLELEAVRACEESLCDGCACCDVRNFVAWRVERERDACAR
jgi:hypothetical protein